MDYIFKRLGHLGEIHLVKPGETKTFCKLRADGPNFKEVTPVDLEPRPSPQLCTDCKDELDKIQAENEEDDTEESDAE